MVDSEGPLEVLSRKFAPWLSQAGYDVSLLDDFRADAALPRDHRAHNAGCPVAEFALRLGLGRLFIKLSVGLELNEPGAALKEYEQALRNDPNRFRSILGRARAAKQLGDIATSRDAYQKLVALSTLAVSERPELSEAKTFLTN
jgi:tetratricopeptide (TPR) repeat protein